MGYTIFMNLVVVKNPIRPRKNTAEGDEKHVMLFMGESRRVLAKNRGQARRPDR